MVTFSQLVQLWLDEQGYTPYVTLRDASTGPCEILVRRVTRPCMSYQSSICGYVFDNKLKICGRYLRAEDPELFEKLAYEISATLAVHRYWNSGSRMIYF